MTPINQQIRAARKAKGMTQQQLADQLGLHGLTKQAVSKLEKNGSNPTYWTLYAISSALKCSFEINAE